MVKILLLLVLLPFSASAEPLCHGVPCNQYHDMGAEELAHIHQYCSANPSHEACLDFYGNDQQANNNNQEPCPPGYGRDGEYCYPLDNGEGGNDNNNDTSSNSDCGNNVGLLRWEREIRCNGQSNNTSLGSFQSEGNSAPGLSFRDYVGQAGDVQQNPFASGLINRQLERMPGY